MCISLIYYVVGVLGNRLLRKNRKRSGICLVLYYHGIEERFRQRFARQLEDLLALGRPTSPLLDRALETRARNVVVTFDDGLESVFANAMPELQRRAIPFAVFVPAGKLGVKPDWSTKTKKAQAANGGVVVSAERLRQLSGHELMTVGSHGMTHTNLVSIGEARAREELFQSKRTLEAIVGKPVTLVSFPYGAYTSAHIRYAREMGYRHCFSIEPGEPFVCAEQAVVGRIEVDPTDWRLEYRLKIRGAYGWQSSVWAARRQLTKAIHNLGVV